MPSSSRLFRWVLGAACAVGGLGAVMPEARAAFVVFESAGADAARGRRYRGCALRPG